MKITVAQSLEWVGVLTAIVYSLLVASNVGLEFLGFALLLISAFSIGLWAYLGASWHSIVAVFLCDCRNSRHVTMVLTTASRWLLHRKLAVSGLSTVAFATRRLTFFLRQFETTVATLQHRCLFLGRCLQKFFKPSISLFSHVCLFLNDHLGVGKC